jgi:hypothetical protein
LRAFSLTSLARPHPAFELYIPKGALLQNSTQHIDRIDHPQPSQPRDLDSMDDCDQPESMDMSTGLHPEWETNNLAYPTSFTQVPHYVPSHTGASYDESSLVGGYQDQLQHLADTGVPNPVIEGHSLLDALPQEPSTATLPSHLPHLCNVYAAGYDADTSLNSTRMEHAKALALALLQHYYPESRGYMVQPSSLGPVAKHGMTFLLKADDGTDPDFTPLSPKKDPPKKGKKKPTKAQLVSQEKAEYARQFNYWYPLTTAMTWHFVEPENIAGFEVLKKSTSPGAGEDVYQPYTYLAIMIDDLQTFPSFAATNDVHRGDILTDVLCRSGKIRFGHGILLFGTHLEFYDFDNGKETTIDSSDSEEDVEGAVNIDEPRVSLAEVVDLRTMDLQMVDRAFREMAEKNVQYLDEGAGAADVQDVVARTEQPEVLMSEDEAMANM